MHDFTGFNSSLGREMIEHGSSFHHFAQTRIQLGIKLEEHKTIGASQMVLALHFSRPATIFFGWLSVKGENGNENQSPKPFVEGSGPHSRIFRAL